MSEPSPEPDLVRCPNCAEWIKWNAILCRFCNSGLSPVYFYPCPFCAEMVRKEAEQCKYCRSNLIGEQSESGRTRLPVTEEIAGKWRLDEKPRFQANLALIHERGKVIIEQLRHELDISSQTQIGEDKQAQIRARIREIVNSDPAILTMMEKGILLQNILDEIFGFSVLGPLLRDPSVQGVFVNRPSSVYVERHGCFEKTSVVFDDEQHLQEVINRIVQPVGSELNHDSPVVSRVLPNGTWVLAARDPASDDAALLILRVSHSHDKV